MDSDGFRAAFELSTYAKDSLKYCFAKFILVTRFCVAAIFSFQAAD